MTLEELTIKLEEAYKKWESYYTWNGNRYFCPNYTDGYYLNNARNTILYYKEQMRKLNLMVFPEIYYKDIPPETDSDFMVNTDKIKERAAEALKKFKGNTDYQFILKYKDDKAIHKKENTFAYVLNYVTYLEKLLNKEELTGQDYLRMRTYWNYEKYFDSFKRMRQIIEKLTGTYAGQQISLFNFI